MSKINKHDMIIVSIFIIVFIAFICGSTWLSNTAKSSDIQTTQEEKKDYFLNTVADGFKVSVCKYYYSNSDDYKYEMSILGISGKMATCTGSPLEDIIESTQYNSSAMRDLISKKALVYGFSSEDEAKNIKVNGKDVKYTLFTVNYNGNEYKRAFWYYTINSPYYYSVTGWGENDYSFKNNGRYGC